MSNPLTIAALTGIPYIPHLEFQSLSLYRRVQSIPAAPDPYARDRLWLAAYFQNEIETAPFPPVSLRWISPEIGWGVFAEKNIPAMHFIAEYTGLVRKATRADRHNRYCFHYLGPYCIDAQRQGGISRYINHSSAPNLDAVRIRHNSIFPEPVSKIGFPSASTNRIICFTNQPVKAGDQLCFDYGPGYWNLSSKTATDLNRSSD